MGMKIKKGDNIMIVTGKDRGKSGKIFKVLPKEGRVIIEGLNLKKKHVRPRKQGEKGQIVNIPGSLNISNVMILCKNCDKKTRVGFKFLEDKNKIRICRKCGEEI